MVRAIMHGCNGAMGQVISGIAAKDEEISIVAGIDMRTEQKNDYPVFASLNECKVEADVVIDFSNAAAVDELLDWCAEKKSSGSALYDRSVRRTACKSRRDREEDSGSQISKYVSWYQYALKASERSSADSGSGWI